MLNDVQILEMGQSEGSCGPDHRLCCGEFSHLNSTLTPVRLHELQAVASVVY